MPLGVRPFKSAPRVPKGLQKPSKRVFRRPFRGKSAVFEAHKTPWVIKHACQTLAKFPHARKDAKAEAWRRFSPLLSSLAEKSGDRRRIGGLYCASCRSNRPGTVFGALVNSFYFI